MKKSFYIIASLFISIAACKSTKETAKTETLNCAETAYTFATDIQPLIAKNCGGCHSPQKKKGGLVLDTPESIKSLASEGKLLCVMRGKKCKVMPPDQPLLKAQVDQVECWINNGMK